MPALDGWRCASILLVLAAHAGLPGIPGGLGVTIFFFISGLLITGQLSDELRRDGRIDLASFYRRRALRLMPASTAFVVVAGSFYVVAGGVFHPLAWLAALFYVANYAQLSTHLFDTSVQGLSHPFVILWSLAIEEQFYLGWPLLLMALAGRRLGAPAAVLFCVVLCLAWRFHLAPLCGHPQACGPHGDDWIGKSTDTRADSLAFGALGALLLGTDGGGRLTRLVRRPGLVVAAAVLLALSVVVRDAAFRDTWRYTAQGLALLVLVPASLMPGSRLGAALSRRHPVAIGRLSYGLYLWHWLALMVVSRLDAGPAASVALFGLLTAVLALASWVAIERPMIRLRRRAGSHASDRLLGQADRTALHPRAAVAR